MKDSSKYIFPQCAFGPNAIQEMVMGHMRERERVRSFKDTAIQKGGTLDTIESNGDTDSVQDSSSSSSSSPPLSMKKIKIYGDYFHPG